MNRKNKKRKKGFTLVELLAVLVITGIVLVIALQTYGHITKNSDSSKYDYQWELVKNGSDIYSDGMQDNMIDGDCLLIDYSLLTFTDLVKEDDIKCEGYVVLIKDGNKSIYKDDLLNCTKDKKVVHTSKYDLTNKNQLNQGVIDYGNGKKVNINQCKGMFDSNVDIDPGDDDDNGNNNSNSGLGDVTTNSIKVSGQCTEYGNFSIKTIRYLLFRKDNNAPAGDSGDLDYIDSNLTYEFKELDHNTDYYVQVKCTNNAGNDSISDSKPVKTKELKAPTIEEVGGTLVNGWYTEYKYKIIYHDENVATPIHYFKSAIYDKDLIASANRDIYECEDGEKPGTCSDTYTTTLKANTWYKVEDSNRVKDIEITYTYFGTEDKEFKGTLIGSISDNPINQKHNYRKTEKEILKNIKIDSSEPKIATSIVAGTTDYEIKLVCITGPSGVKETSIKRSDDKIRVNKGKNEQNEKYNLRDNSSKSKIDDWYLHDVSCTANNGKTKTEPKNFQANVSTDITVSPKGNVWAREKTYTISYNSSSEFSQLGNYFQVPLNATSNLNVQQCGNDRYTPSACDTTTTNLKAGYWYRTTSSEVKVTIRENVGVNSGKTIYSRIGDTNRYIVGTSFLVSRIDNVAPDVPTVTATINNGRDIYNGGWTNSDVKINLNASDNPNGSGIRSYQFSTNCTGQVDGELFMPETKIRDTQDRNICYRAIDNAGNASNWGNPVTVKIDKIKPVMNSIKEVRMNIENSSIELEYDARDEGGSGIKQYYMTVRGEGGNIYSSYPTNNRPDIGLRGAIDYTLVVTIEDNAGNRTNVRPVLLKYDEKYDENNTCQAGFTTKCALYKECDLCGEEITEKKCHDESYVCGTDKCLDEDCYDNQVYGPGAHNCYYDCPKYCKREVCEDVGTGLYTEERCDKCGCERFEWSDCATGGITYRGGWRLQL